MSVLLENAILINTERFNRELKTEIQLAPVPGCEMWMDCGYTMGFPPSVTTFFILWRFLLALPV